MEDPRAHLSEEDRRKAEEEQSISASATYEAIRREGEEELERNTGALTWSGLAAGFSMSLCMIGEGVLHAHLPDAPWRPIITAAGFSLGFLAVTLGSQQLFTENTLTPIVPLLAEKSAVMLRNVLRLWLAVLLANLIAGAISAIVIGRTQLFPADVHTAFQELATQRLAPSFALNLLKGIFGGWIIALLLWMLPAAKTAHIWVIVIMTGLIALGGFAHVISGSIEMFYLVARGVASAGEVLGRFVLPALIGNALGGVVLVAVLNHAQVVAGKQHETPAT